MFHRPFKPPLNHNYRFHVNYTIVHDDDQHACFILALQHLVNGQMIRMTTRELSVIGLAAYNSYQSICNLSCFRKLVELELTTSKTTSFESRQMYWPNYDPWQYGMYVFGSGDQNTHREYVRIWIWWSKYIYHVEPLTKWTYTRIEIILIIWSK